MAVFNEAVSTIFVDGYLSVSSVGNNCCIPYTVYVLCYFYDTKDLFRPVDVLFCDGGKIFLVAPLRYFQKTSLAIKVLKSVPVCPFENMVTLYNCNPENVVF